MLTNPAKLFYKRKHSESVKTILKDYLVNNDDEDVLKFMENVDVISLVKNNFLTVSDAKKIELCKLLNLKSIEKYSNSNRIMMNVKNPNRFLLTLKDLELEHLTYATTYYIDKVLAENSVKALLSFCSFDDLSSGSGKYFDENIYDLYEPEDDLEILEDTKILPKEYENTDSEEEIFENTFFAFQLIIKLLHENAYISSLVPKLIEDIEKTSNLLSELEQNRYTKAEINKYCRQLVKRWKEYQWDIYWVGKTEKQVASTIRYHDSETNLTRMFEYLLNIGTKWLVNALSPSEQVYKMMVFYDKMAQVVNYMQSIFNDEEKILEELLAADITIN